MFTDSYVTPIRLEILIDTLRTFRVGLEVSTLYRLLQPKPLTDTTPIASQTLSAARQLGLIEERGDKVSLTSELRLFKTRDLVLRAFDKTVLTSTEVEPHFALFFSYLLGMGKDIYKKRVSREAWVEGYKVKVIDLPTDPFNPTRITGFDRWYDYIGLGWYDPANNFQAMPYARLERSLNIIFGNEKRLASDEFMKSLAIHCPELDGGNLFCQANRDFEGSSTRVCTLGLSHALIELEYAGRLRLFRPADSSGWSIGDAEPQHEAHPDRAGSRISTLELLN